MDIELEKSVREALEKLNQISDADFDARKMDPIAKMMLVALLHEAKKINDSVEAMPYKVMERFCTQFIPREKIEAMPAITLVHPKPKKDMGLVKVGQGATFSFKTTERTQPLSYMPIFKTTLIPHGCIMVLTQDKLKTNGKTWDVEWGSENANVAWVGITTKTQVETLKGLSVMIKGTKGVTPERVRVGANMDELQFASFWQMHQLEMVHPFDAQQASLKMFDMMEMWKREMLNIEDTTLIYITDETNDRDLFKPRRFPMAGKTQTGYIDLPCLDDDTLWLCLEFPKGVVLGDKCDVEVNIVPVANVEVDSVILTPSQPIAKLLRKGNFFLSVLETTSAARKMELNSYREEVIIRDFDSACYNNEDLYRDVRNLYNKFIDDYYSFIEYNGVKSGALLKQLREVVNEIGTSVNQTGKLFNSGTYVMKNITQEQQGTTVTKVNYISTQGKKGNMPDEGDMMENKSLPDVEKEMEVMMRARGGADKASADERYELLRYYSLTNDRLYTKMDVDAFVRKEVMAKFGKSEFDRIHVRITIEGIGADTNVKRAMYVVLEFKDKKNHEKAVNDGFVRYLEQNIEAKGCIALPVIITLVNLE
ncbi:MAG: hypothetical protein IKH88_18280 [Prevotella sp.]|nr:hypothetical protein [Prevotella sp.]